MNDIQINEEQLVFTEALNYYNKKEYNKSLEIINSHLPKQKNNFLLYNLLGLIKYEHKNYVDAIKYFKKSYFINNDFLDALKNESFTLIKLNKLDEAEKIILSIIKKNPSDNECLLSLGNIYYISKRYNESLDIYNIILEKNPNDFKALYSISRIYKLKNKNQKFLHYAIKALRIKKDFGDPLYAIALMLLRNSKYKLGWKFLESRFYKSDPVKIIGNEQLLPKNKMWKGKLSDPCTILFITEQGIGDSFQYIRYLEIFKKHGFKSILLTKINIHKILSSSKFIDKIYFKIEDLNIKYDYWLPIMSIPYRIYNEYKKIPSNIPYIFAKQELIAKWQSILDKKINIGICWEGSIKERSINIKDLEFLKDFKEKINLICLQKNFCKSDIKSNIMKKIIKFYKIDEEKENSFLDTAAIISNLSFVISCDTSVAHLSGALGKKTILLLKKDHYWTWQKNKKTSEWYPNLEIIHLKDEKDDKIRIKKIITNLIYKL